MQRFLVDLYPPLGNFTTHIAILPVLLTTSHIAFLAQAYSAQLPLLSCIKTTWLLPFFFITSDYLEGFYMCALLCYLHSGKNANLFPCILGNFEKKSETNFTILREHLCMLHYSSMPAIEHSPIEKNKKSQYVRTVCTTCIKLKDKKSLFVHKFTFLCIFLTHIWM